jgi:hypothetical protein
MNINNASLALTLLPNTNGGSGAVLSLLASGAGGATSAFTSASAHVALQQANKNEAKQLEQAAKDPVTKRELERYKKVVKEAKTVEEVLEDPVARKVFLTANGLRDQVDYVGLVKKGVLSDPNDPNSLANRMADVNPAWRNVAVKYNLQLVGVGRLQVSDTIKAVSDSYIAEKRLDILDQQLPGLGTAILFKKIAPTLDKPIKVLGVGVAREVVTTALGIPKQIAFQSLEAQERAIAKRLDVNDLKDPKYLDRLLLRYLIEYNGGGLTGLVV